MSTKNQKENRKTIRKFLESLSKEERQKLKERLIRKIKAKQQIYYDILPLLQEAKKVYRDIVEDDEFVNSLIYYILLGQRANGKSYQVKYKCIWEACYECDYEIFMSTGKKIHKRRFMLAYTRRYDTDITRGKVEAYFADMDIREITDGEYSLISVYNGDIYFANLDEHGDVVRGKLIGHAFAVNKATSYKSQAYPEIGNIIFEEFLSREREIVDEPKLFESIVSTIKRRDKVSVYLIANTETRLSSYFEKWGIEEVLNLDQGEKKIYVAPTGHCTETGQEEVILYACEYCQNVAAATATSATNKMVTDGVYDTDVYPHLPGDISDYRERYSIYYEYGGRFKFVIRLLVTETGEPFLFIHSANYKPKTTKRVVTTDFTFDKYATEFLTTLTKFDDLVIDLIQKGKVCYGDDLDGTEFNDIRKIRGRY